MILVNVKCKNHVTHQKAYREVRDEYQNPITRESFHSFTADMQKVILLPKLTSKEHVFVSRLVLFNETFASLDGNDDLLILWHEGVAGRSAQVVATIYLKCMEVTSDKKYLFWADNCSGQNKNWFLFTLFTKVVNSDDWYLDVIRMKYLNRNMYYKTSFKEKEYISCDFSMKRSDVMKFPTAMTEERGISSVKK